MEVLCYNIIADDIKTQSPKRESALKKGTKMKIIVVSDSHRNFAALSYVVNNNPDADLYIHLGDGENEFRDVHNEHPDKPMVFVGGNNDFGSHKQTRIIPACGYKIFCCHGHNHHVHGGLSLLLADARRNDCQIALYGHTHLYRTEIIEGIYVMNPGSLDYPRNHNKPSYGIIEIEPYGEINMEIIETEFK